MYIGIIDQDLIQEKVFSPNLETMQLSTYHKQKKDIVDLVVTSKNIGKYDKLYLVKNKNNHKFLPKVIADPRTECIGLGFTNGKYKPKPELDNITPDLNIYDKYYRMKKEQLSKVNQQRYSSFKKYTHYRLMLDKNKVNSISPSGGRITIYDTNPIEIPGMFELCNNFRTVKFKYPLYTNDLEEAKKWLNCSWFHIENKLYYIGELNDKNYKQFVAEESHHHKTVCFLIDLTTPEDSLQEFFSLWLNRILYAKTRNVQINLKITVKSQSEFYNSLFSSLATWTNERIAGKSFKESANLKKQKEKFDNLCKRDYNINRMVQIVPKSYREERYWEYVN